MVQVSLVVRGRSCVLRGDAIDALDQLGDSLRLDGHFREAEASYRKSLVLADDMRSAIGPLRKVRPAHLVVEAGWEDQYEEMLELLDCEELASSLFLRNLVSDRAMVQTRLRARRGAPQVLKFARLALDLAAATELQLPRHPDIAGVEADDDLIHGRMELAGDSRRATPHHQIGRTNEHPTECPRAARRRVPDRPMERGDRDS